MKTALIALATLVAVLAVPVVTSAQDWVMDWHSTGSVAGNPFHWDITGTSPASLTPVSGGLPPTFTGQAFNLSFTSQGGTFGGLVAQGSFQDQGFAVPAATPLNSFSEVAGGDFNVTGNHFTLHAFVGLGHNNAEFTATGTRNVRGGPTANAPEPGVLLVGAAGLIGAAVIRARRRR
jgi:hypothetical protein